MTTEIREKKQCECCGRIEEGDYHKFYYGRRLKADEKKELQTQIVQIGGSKSVYLCSSCLRKGFIEDPQVAIMLITFVVFSAAIIILYGLDFLGIMTLADKDSMSPLAVLAMPFILALAVNIFTGYFIFDSFFGFIYTHQAIKASNIYKKELTKQGFGIMYAPKQYRAMLQQRLCQKDPNEKEEFRPEAIQERNANESVSTEAARTDKSIASETQKKGDANICPRCQGDSNVMFYCKECGYTDKSRSFIIVFGILLAIGIGVQGLFSAFSQNASLWLEIGKIACCGAPGIVLAVWGIQEALSRGNYERWKQRHSQEMDKLVDFHTQNLTANTEEIAQFMNRKHRWVESMLEEMEKAGKNHQATAKWYGCLKVAQTVGLVSFTNQKHTTRFSSCRDTSNSAGEKLNNKQRTTFVGFLVMSSLVLGILLSGCGAAKPPQEVVDTAKNAWKLFHAMRQDAVTNEELNAFEITNWEKAKLPPPFDDLAALEGYGTEVYCLSFKPAISEPVIDDMQNMLVLHKGENWREAGSAWGTNEANWVGLLCGTNWENDPLCFHVNNSAPGQLYWLGASETMLKNAGCSIGQSK